MTVGVYASPPVAKIDATIEGFTAYLIDIEVWLRSSRLRLNHPKTELFEFQTSVGRT